MPQSHHRLAFAVASVGLLAGLASAAPTGVFIPVVINIYKDAGITEEQAKAAIKEANKIFNQNKACITLVPVKTVSPASAGDDGNDGLVDWSTREFDKWTEAGRKEIEKLPNKKGIKLSFAKEPEKGAANPGWAWHRQCVACVKNRGNAGLTGSTIAHEVGHIMSLSGGHKINGTTNANGAGHAPDVAGDAGRDNVMAPSNYRNADPSKLKFTPDQIAEIKKERFVRGKCSTQFRAAFPAEKEPQQWGAKTDALRDAASTVAYSDIVGVTLTSLNDGVSPLEGNLTLGDRFSGLVNNVYSFGFDSDANAGTGVAYKGFAGVDHAVEIAVTGDAGVYAAAVTVRDLVGGIDTPVANAADVGASDLQGDSDVPGPSAFMGEILFRIDKALLNMVSIGANDVPVAIIAEENGVVVDTDDTIFDLQKWLEDPTLMTSGDGIPTPGAPYPFTIAGLAPNSPYTLTLNDEIVAEGMLDANGAAAGSFIFPASELSPADNHFLVAMDDTGEFAYSITCPEPGALMVFAMLFAPAGLRRRRAA